MVMPIELNIKNKEDFLEKNLRTIMCFETVAIHGFDKNVYYSEIKVKILSVIEYLDHTNLLILDFSSLEEISFANSVKVFGPLVKKDLKIVAIAQEKLHRLIKRFGITVFSTLEEYQRNINYELNN